MTGTRLRVTLPCGHTVAGHVTRKGEPVPTSWEGPLATVWERDPARLIALVGECPRCPRCPKPGGLLNFLTADDVARPGPSGGPRLPVPSTGGLSAP